jgi:hypothetical protein
MLFSIAPCGKYLCFFGVQDACRKRRDPSQTLEPWVSSIVQTCGEAVYVTISLERWSKAKNIVTWIKEACQSITGMMEFKTLESH